MVTAPHPRCCWICGKSVQVEECKVDEHGLPVHEDCYAAKLALQQSQLRYPPQPAIAKHPATRKVL